MIRLAKVAVIAALAAFALIVAYNNIFDYKSNYQFVRHVLSMDTTFPDNALRPRAIDSETLWRAAYAVIIAAEALLIEEAPDKDEQALPGGPLLLKTITPERKRSPLCRTPDHLAAHQQCGSGAVKLQDSRSWSQACAETQ